MTEMEWPWQYNFPPFYTLQPNLETRSKQLKVWAKLVLDYCKLNKIFVLDIGTMYSSELFYNQSLKRQLSKETIILVLELLQGTNNAEPLDKGKLRWYVLWHSVNNWSELIYSWAQNCGYVNSVCTLFEIIHADNEEFQDIDQNLLIKILKNLESNKRAELILSDDTAGVKFF